MKHRNTFVRLGSCLLFPHLAIRLLLVPIALACLIYSLVFLRTDSIAAIASYVLSFYTLVIWCLQIPRLIVGFRHFRQENRFVRIWTGDVRLRVRVSLYSALVWNTAYAMLQLGLGWYHASIWYYSLAGYYICLALMRFVLSRHIAKHKPGERMRQELIIYRACGWVFLAVNLALSSMVFLMIYQNRTAQHHPITTIALATYAFASLTIAIMNAIRYRKYNSPVYSASKAISLAAACVSMITLTSTMLSSFRGQTDNPRFRTMMLAGLGAAVTVFITTMALSMIARANREIKSPGESV